MNDKVLITGITGFLGSEIAKKFYSEGFEVIGLKRKNSELTRCSDFYEKINWIDISEEWEQKVVKMSPQIIIHSAWEGVGAEERDNWNLQSNNIVFTLKLLSIAREAKVKKFIGFGSQAEYGNFSGIVNENYPVNPNSAYGLNKNICGQTINVFCEQNNIEWYWLRLFSFFGEREAANWFIPTLVNNILENKAMDMTPGEQRYAYMYIGDLAELILKLTNSTAGSGIYNISSKNSISLKEIVERIIKIINPKEVHVNIGAVPYRENQPMIVQGDISKLEEAIGTIFETSFDYNLKKVVQFNLNKRR
jgi:nucleoside-diphosphate-sugar epimerase